jgi:hypothetical protein
MRRASAHLLASVGAIALSMLVGAASATAQDVRPSLQGAFGFTGTAACLVAPGSSTSPTNPTPGTALPNSGFDSSLQPIDGKSFSRSFSVEGIRTFHGDGTGTVRGTGVTVAVPPTPGPAGSGYPTFSPSASLEKFSYQFTYTVNADGSWTADTVPGTYNGSFLTGPRTGQTYTVENFPTFSGLISADGQTLTAAHLTTTVETNVFSNGDVWPMICHRSRVFIKLGSVRHDNEQGRGQ